jgi:hypothetical protein
MLFKKLPVTFLLLSSSIFCKLAAQTLSIDPPGNEKIPDTLSAQNPLNFHSIPKNQGAFCLGY